MYLSNSVQSWIGPIKPPVAATIRLFCFSYAGGGASLFRQWQPRLHQAIQVVPVQLPGREERLREPLFTSIPAVVDALTEILPPLLDMPFAFFGHAHGRAD